MLYKADKFKFSPLSRNYGSGKLPMTAMIDIIFLLLIFFLLTAKFRPVEDYLPVSVPARRVEGSAVSEPLKFVISQSVDGCMLSVAGDSVVVSKAGRSELREMIEGVLKKQNRYLSDPVEVICSGEVSWQSFVIIYDVLYGAGLTDISFDLGGAPASVLK